MKGEANGQSGVRRLLGSGVGVGLLGHEKARPAMCVQEMVGILGRKMREERAGK